MRCTKFELDIPKDGEITGRMEIEVACKKKEMVYLIEVMETCDKHRTINYFYGPYASLEEAESQKAGLYTTLRGREENQQLCTCNPRNKAYSVVTMKTYMRTFCNGQPGWILGNRLFDRPFKFQHGFLCMTKDVDVGDINMVTHYDYRELEDGWAL
jgi:hypothetical protein